jgi:DNA-binding PadR family transcriptional regulator
MLSSGSLTPTSFALLGLLAIKPWSSYELAQQMGHSLGRFWPRAQSKLYEEPKKLVHHGLAGATEDRVGRRTRTIYTITPRGRRALAQWLREPGQAPVLEFEQLMKVFFSENATTDDTLATLAAAEQWARDRAAESAAVGREYLAGKGRFPQRMAQQQLTAGFLNEFYALVGRWATWAAGHVEAWPDDHGGAGVDAALLEQLVRHAQATALGDYDHQSPTAAPAAGMVR